MKQNTNSKYIVYGYVFLCAACILRTGICKWKVYM